MFYENVVSARQSFSRRHKRLPRDTYLQVDCCGDYCFCMELSTQRARLFCTGFILEFICYYDAMDLVNFAMTRRYTFRGYLNLPVAYGDYGVFSQ